MDLKKDFVPYRIALDMKSIGFNEPCLFFGNQLLYRNSNFCIVNEDAINAFISFGDELIIAPTFSQVFKWFREKHDLQASNIMFTNSKYDAEITRYKGTQCVWGNGPIYDTYEKAELELLVKLIELVKNEKQI